LRNRGQIEGARFGEENMHLFTPEDVAGVNA
jgi:hypothetical protein